MIITLIIILILILSFWGAFGGLIKFWYNEHQDRKAQKEFEERQERYRKMI